MLQLFDIRLAMLASGYVIIPVIGKKPPLEGWQNVKSASREVLEAWERDYPAASNTGILTRFTPTFDIDLRNELAALAVENMVREHFNGRGTILTRIGFAPKRAIPFRTKEPFKKLDIRFIAPDGVKPDKLEFLGMVNTLSPMASIPKRAANMSGSAAIRLLSPMTSCRKSRSKRPSNCGTKPSRCW